MEEPEPGDGQSDRRRLLQAAAECPAHDAKESEGRQEMDQPIDQVIPEDRSATGGVVEGEGKIVKGPPATPRLAGGESTFPSCPKCRSEGLRTIFQASSSRNGPRRLFGVG